MRIMDVQKERYGIGFATIRARAWHNEPVRLHRVRVEHGRVKVWDPQGDIFTACHRLAPAEVEAVLEATAP